jgi:hypothetical protein
MFGKPATTDTQPSENFTNHYSPIHEGYSFSGEGEAFRSDKQEVLDNLGVGVEKVQWIIGKIKSSEKREKL